MGISRSSALICAAAIACSGSVPARAGPLDEPTLGKLLGWAAHFSGRPVPAGVPATDTAALPAEAFARTVCAGDLDRCRNVVAAYDAEHRRIVHRDSLDMNSPTDRSFIVHELVHYLQHLQRGAAFSSADCKASMQSEREAYRAQNRYLMHFGVHRRVGQALLFTHCDDGAASPAAEDNAAPDR